VFGSGEREHVWHKLCGISTGTTQYANYDYDTLISFVEEIPSTVNSRRTDASVPLPQRRGKTVETLRKLSSKMGESLSESIGGGSEDGLSEGKKEWKPS